MDTLLKITELRELHGLTQHQAGYLLGLSGANRRITVGQWEKGYAIPAKSRRVKFINYLVDHLKLRKDYKQFHAIWTEVMVELWCWAPLSEAEWKSYFPNTIQKINTDEKGHPEVVFVHSENDLIPKQLPPKTYYFTGRSVLVEHVKNKLYLGAIVILQGHGGQGKTAISWKALHDLLVQNELFNRFPDGVLFHSFYGRPDVNLALAHFAKSLGVDDVRDPPSACKRAISGKRLLLILDGAEDADDIWAILHMRSESGVLITTRCTIYGIPQDNLIVVEKLTSQESVELLQRWGKNYADDKEVIKKVCQAFDHLALAVRLSGIYIYENGVSIADYLNWILEETQQTWNPLVVEKRELNLIRLIKQIMDQVGVEAQRVLFLAGYMAFLPFDAKVIWEVLCNESRTNTEDVDNAISVLIDYGLASYTEDMQFVMTHALIHNYAKHNSSISMIENLGGYFLRQVKQESEKGVQGYNVLDHFLSHIISILRNLHANNKWILINSLSLALEDYLDLRGYWTERVIVAEFGLEAAKALRCNKDQAAHLTDLGRSYSDTGYFSIAIDYYKQAIAITKETEDLQSQGNQYGNLALAYMRNRQYDEALCYREKALQLHRLAGFIQGVGQNLGALAAIYYHIEKTEEAIELFLQAIPISREAGDLRWVASHLGNLGESYVRKSELSKALDCHEEALSISQQIGDIRGEGIALINLGDLQIKLRKMAEAIRNLEQAQIIFQQINSPYVSVAKELLEKASMLLHT